MGGLGGGGLSGSPAVTHSISLLIAQGEEQEQKEAPEEPLEPDFTSGFGLSPLTRLFVRSSCISMT